MEEKDILNNFAFQLKHWRTSKGLSQKKLAELIGVSQTLIYRYEHGDCRISPETAATLIGMGFPLEQVALGGHYRRTDKAELTDEERAFAERNHKLVFAFLQSRRLSYDDWYDVVIFGYLHAVQTWLSRAELQKYKFSVIAYSAMRDRVRKERRKARLHPKSVSIYDIIPGTEDFTYGDILCDPSDCVFAF